LSLAERLSALAPEQRTLLEALRAKQQEQRKQAARAHMPPPVPRVSGSDGNGDWPLSFDQERLWFLQELDPRNRALNIDAASRIRGPLDLALIRRALDEVVRRHAALRTTFVTVAGRPVQRVAPTRHQELSIVDLAGLPAGRREPEALSLLSLGSRTAFDLERGPLMRASLMRLDERDHICLVTLHHLVTDWISFQIFFADLGALYAAYGAGLPSPLPPPPSQYPDYAVWQREWLQGEVYTDLVGFWRERLAGFPTALELPTDRPRPPVQRMRGGLLRVDTGPRLAEDLRALSRRENASLFITTLALIAALLHRVSVQERMILGTNTANRNRPEIEPVFGYFLTQLPFAIDLAGDPTFRELLARVRRTALDAFAHQDLPFGKLVEATNPPRDASRPPLIQTLAFVLEDQPARSESQGISFEALTVWDGRSRYDLMWGLYSDPEGLRGPLEYDADLFDPATVARLLDRFYGLGAAVTAGPEVRLSALPVLEGAARHQVLREWNDTSGSIPHWTAIERFEAQAAGSPEAPALAFAGAEISFGDLLRRSERLARLLRALGVRRESRVVLLLDRTPALVESILAVWRAGGACVPLDPEAPVARTAALLADADPAVLIHDGMAPLPEGLTVPVLDPAAVAEADADLGERPRGEDLAYMIYTSGTTGTPKAVLVEHRSLAHTLAVVQERFGFDPDDRMPHLARFSFDISLFELLAPLLAGGVCELLRQEEILDERAMLAAVSRATRLHAVPSLMRRIVAAQKGLHLKTVFTGGDLVPPDLLIELEKAFPGAERVVLYGPTEATIVCTAQVIQGRPSRTLIGRPFTNVEARVIDRWGDAPPGVPGELWIGGSGVARGYHRQEGLTAERFVERDGCRFYRTGDVARYRADGTLEFLGRTDHQVKVRGFRVEPGEVEARLAEHSGVRDAAVVAADDGRGERRLVAYCVGKASPAELRDHLGALLPSYMIPETFVILPELPRTAHGKLDRGALPEPGSSGVEREYLAPSNPIEEQLARACAEVLGRERVGMRDNFFALGGHSLLATQLVALLRDRYAIEMPLRWIFEAADLRGVADRVLDEGLKAMAEEIDELEDLS
jgi:amino acid adenylation domain-containing protein